MSFGHLGERACHASGALPCVGIGLCFTRSGDRLGERLVHASAIEQAKTRRVPMLVARDRIEPRQEVRIFVKAMRVPSRGEPRLLKQIFGDVAPSREANEKAPHRLTVAQVDLVERAFPLLAQPRDELPIGRIWAHTPS